MFLLAFAPAAEAKFLDQAKFKLLSMSGSEALTWSEDSTGGTDTATGMPKRCVGTASSRIGFRSAERATLYVFLKRVHGAVRTIIAPDPDPSNFDLVYLDGEATVSRSVSYTETAGCQVQPTDCPETTVPAEPFVLGTSDPGGGVGAGAPDYKLPPGHPESCESVLSTIAGEPFGPVQLSSPTVFANAIPRRQLFDDKRARLEGSVAVEEPLARTVGPPSADTGTVSGTYAEEIAVKLKRLELKEDEKRG